MKALVRLTSADVDLYLSLRRRMLADSPWAFGASPEDDRALDPAQVRAFLDEPENAVLAIALEEEGERRLVAAAGVFRAQKRKAAHRAAIWGVFVEPAHRGSGFGRAVLEACLDLARDWPGVDYVDLSVSERSPEALRLYERLGFRAWGREPEATDIDGQRYDEIHLTLRLKGS